LHRLESEIADYALEAWIRPLLAVELPGELHLFAPSVFLSQRVEQRYLDAITKAAAEVAETEIAVRVSVREPDTAAEPAASPRTETSEPKDASQPRTNPDTKSIAASAAAQPVSKVDTRHALPRLPSSSRSGRLFPTPLRASSWGRATLSRARLHTPSPAAAIWGSARSTCRAPLGSERHT